MAVFPSIEWCEEAIRLVNGDPESTLAGAGWVGDFGAVVEPEPGKLKEAFAVYCQPRNGRLEDFRKLREPDELEELEPAYLARATYSVWKGLIQGTLDPVEAVLRKQVFLSGDLQPLVERMRFKGIADRVLAKLDTRFVDDPKP